MERGGISRRALNAPNTILAQHSVRYWVRIGLGETVGGYFCVLDKENTKG